MITEKLTVKKIKQLEEFTAINKKNQKVADFLVEGDVASYLYEDGTEGNLKLDSIRRNWELLIEENEEEVKMSEKDVKQDSMKVGDKVKDKLSGKQGIVESINGQLYTIVNAIEDFPAKEENLILIEKGDNIEDQKVEDQKPKEVKQPKIAEFPSNKINELEGVEESKLAKIPQTGKEYKQQYFEGKNWSYHRVTDSKGHFIAAKFIVNDNEVKLKSPSKKQVKNYLKDTLGIEVSLKW